MDTSTTPNFQSAYLNLFTAYTGPLGPPQPNAPAGIGKLVANAAAARAGINAPFLYVYGTSQAYFPVNNSLQPDAVYSPPVTAGGFAPGMMELAAISHIGPALASLVRMQQYGSAEDRQAVIQSIQSLLQMIDTALPLGTAAAWTNLNPVFETYAGRLASMIGEGLAQVHAWLGWVLADPTQRFTYENLRTALLSPEAGILPYNNIMIATFALANLADHYQALTWLDKTIPANDAISHLSVLLAGSSGRATAGLTPETNPNYQRLEAWANSKGHSLRQRMFILPSGPAFNLGSAPAMAQLTDWPTIEKTARTMWWQTQVAVHLSDDMFKDYPVKEMPVTESGLPKTGEPPLSDFFSKLKFALGHANQELASCTSGFMLQALLQNNTNPVGLWIPGLPE